MGNKIQSYKDLIVWQKSIELSLEIYRITEMFPREEIFCLSIQMRRCSISIPSNIAEGRGRGTRKDFAHFLRISLGSSNELQTQIEIAKRLPKTKHINFKKAEFLLDEIIKILNTIIKKLNFPES
ncbi:MAG: four helix bundle protein [Patescibacteria group bacterium]